MYRFICIFRQFLKVFSSAFSNYQRLFNSWDTNGQQGEINHAGSQLCPLLIASNALCVVIDWLFRHMCGPLRWVAGRVSTVGTRMYCLSSVHFLYHNSHTLAKKLSLVTSSLLPAHGYLLQYPLTHRSPSLLATATSSSVLALLPRCLLSLLKQAWNRGNQEIWCISNNSPKVEVSPAFAGGARNIFLPCLGRRGHLLSPLREERSKTILTSVRTLLVSGISSFS